MTIQEERMRFAVDTWDPGYGQSLELETDLGQSTAVIDTDVETGDWRPVAPKPQERPQAILFVDGVRRIEARVWLQQTDFDTSMALCASYAAGVMCCCAQGAHLLEAQPRRGVFSVAPRLRDIATTAGTYRAHSGEPRPDRSVTMTLSAALQQQLAKLEVVTALSSRNRLKEHGIGAEQDLLVVDGPLGGREHLPRALGFIKTHRTSYLPAEKQATVGELAAGERTPVFRMGTSWERHSWYLRLPGRPGGPWAGVVRVECGADLDRESAIRLADLSQAVLPGFASTEYKDSRAPQNLYPIGGLERELRRRLGDPALLYRALRKAAF